MAQKKTLTHRHVCFAEEGGPIQRITDQAIAAAEQHFARRVSAIRQVINDAINWSPIDEVEANVLAGLLDLAARWTPAPLGHLLDQAQQLAALEGREAVYADAEPARFADEITLTRQEFKEQIDFLTQKRGKPTRVWTDAMHGDHDRAFVVAGVTDLAMLEEFQAATVEAARTYDLQKFGSEFDRLVEKYGWSYNGGRNWRVRTIFETNIRTSYMAGRLRQMRDPDVVKLRPYWRYRHADTRVPENPRPEHVAFDGLILLWSDPWWEKYFPPNDWKCSCGVDTLSRGDLHRLGKSGPDKAPDIVMRPHLDTTSGQQVMLPEGIGFGWDYMPGDKWERGLVPSALIDHEAATATGDAKGHHLVSIDTPEPMADLLAAARPFASPVMTPGLQAEDYVRAFLAPFGADLGKAVLWNDPAGSQIVISEDLFREHSGAWKIAKRGRDVHAAQLAEAILDPDEIWLGVREVPVDSQPGYVEQMITRRYIRVDPDTALYVMFEVGRRAWGAVTGYASFNRSKPDYRHIDKQRVGKLLWKRK